MGRAAEKEKTEADIKQVDKEMTDMTDERKAEHDAFKQAKKDDLAAISLLTEAKKALESFYAKNKIDMGPIQGSVKLAQAGPEFERSEDAAPDATFAKKDKNKLESKGAISALAMIIEDLEDEVHNGI